MASSIPILPLKREIASESGDRLVYRGRVGILLDIFHDLTCLVWVVPMTLAFIPFTSESASSRRVFISST